MEVIRIIKKYGMVDIRTMEGRMEGTMEEKNVLRLKMCYCVGNTRHALKIPTTC